MEDRVNDEFIKYTLEVWQPRTPRRLTEEDAREIIDNITGFFKVLIEWDEKERGKTPGPGSLPL